MSTAINLRRWVKRRDDPLANLAYRCVKSVRGASIPTIPMLHRTLFALHVTIRNAVSDVLRVVWYTPLFQSRLARPASRLYLYGGLPLIMGPLDMEVGPGTRISAQTTFTGRTASTVRPLLRIGGNVDIGWQTTIAVGRDVIIGDNVRIAGRALLAGYPGHPLDAVARAAGLPDTQDQVGDIVLEDDVWLATGVTVSAGVRIGRGTVVAAGSVVTKDLPPFVLAGGVPARVIRQLPDTSGEAE